MQQIHNSKGSLSRPGIVRCVISKTSADLKKMRIERKCSNCSTLMEYCCYWLLKFAFLWKSVSLYTMKYIISMQQLYVLAYTHNIHFPKKWGKECQGKSGAITNSIKSSSIRQMRQEIKLVAMVTVSVLCQSTLLARAASLVPKNTSSI